MTAKTSKPMLALIVGAGAIGGLVGVWAASSGGGLGIAVMIAGFVVAGVAIAFALKNNRSVPPASEAERARAMAPPGDGMARLLVVREGFMGKLQGIDVSVNGRVVTQLKSPRFAAIDVAPGDHVLVASIQKKSTPPLTLSVGPGEVAVARVSVAVGGLSIDPERDTPSLRERLRSIPMLSSQ